MLATRQGAALVSIPKHDKQTEIEVYHVQKRKHMLQRKNEERWRGESRQRIGRVGEHLQPCLDACHLYQVPGTSFLAEVRYSTRIMEHYLRTLRPTGVFSGPNIAF